MKKRYLAAGAALMLTAGLLAGCGSGEQPEERRDAAQDNIQDNADHGDQAAAYAPVTVDNYGREVTVEDKPSKVLTLGPNASELFVALGLSDLVIGNSLDNHSRGALPEYEEAYARIPELTYGSATREAVVTSGADFIYGIDWEFGGDALDVEELAGLGMTTYMNSASTLEEMYGEIRDLGRIFEIEGEAEAFVADQQARIAAVQEQVGQREAIDVLVYDSGGDGVFTAGAPNFETLLIELAGGRNVFDDIEDQQWTTVSYEEVLRRQPEVIVIHDYDAPSLEQKIADIQADPALSQLAAVQAERFVPISLESVLPGGRMAYTVESLARGFYPELYQ
ncbi:ABC transporter substrate-binding protein [Paenibacillus sp. IB182496]|uniref:ABC transporter substrate-binding protein n=1 Tax=Paenibacillus sabuli TaxID=2772509 RepID=A0A927BVW1_9BACL|nr:ABC transporter substrate-binding protein [Paenibacillus sabuli]MBD2847812.1 ABC transporter substrate-binding protein [Paenibacillus sabuli]